MKVLIVGGGGREHAIAWKVAKSPKVDKIYCAPGNAGIASVAECVPIGAMEFDKLADFAQENAIDLTVIGMDDPLCGGIVDVFEARGLRVFGPRKNAAIIEGSKAFSKDLMKKYGIPTAEYENFTDPEKALAYLEKASFPIVLKADGLALGKGVLICNTLEEAKDGVKQIMMDKKFGTAGDEMVIERFMTGREVSALCFCDGENIVPMTSAQDHKRAGDGDTGLNTGGMGTFSPSPFFTPEISAWCMEHIFKPTMAAMKAEGRPFTGILFVGLMLTEEGPKVLEYNARFGDPETQVVLPRMKTDLVQMFDSIMVVSLVVDPANLLDYESGIMAKGAIYDEHRAENELLSNGNQHEVQANYTQKGRDWEREATIELFDGSNTLSYEAPCGIRLRGRVSRIYAQKSFNVYFKDSYGTKKMEYPLFGDIATSSNGDPVTTYKSFCLRSGGNDTELLRYRDSLLQETLGGYDYATQASRPAIVFLNGEFYGVYSLAEKYSNCNVFHARRAVLNDLTGEIREDEAWPEYEGFDAFLKAKSSGQRKHTITEFLYRASIIKDVKFEVFPVGYFSDDATILKMAKK